MFQSDPHELDDKLLIEGENEGAFVLSRLVSTVNIGEGLNMPASLVTLGGGGISSASDLGLGVASRAA